MGALQNAALVAFEAPEIIGPQILRDEAAGLLLALDGIGGNETAFQRPFGQFQQQRLERWNLVALFLDGLLGHRQAQAMADRRKQLERFAIRAGAAAQTLAIHGQPLEDGNLLRHHPLADAEVKMGGIQSVHHAEKGAVAGQAAAMGLGILPAAQRPQLPLRELFAFILKSLVAARSHEHGCGGAGQHEGLRVAQTVAAAAVLALFKHFQQRAQLAPPQRARPADFLLLPGQVGGQATLVQNPIARGRSSRR